MTSPSLLSKPQSYVTDYWVSQVFF